jgi:membrane protease YdiL (CAAX protease family)
VSYTARVLIALGLSLTFVFVIWAAIVFLNERHNLLSCDRFPSTAEKWGAYAALLGLFVVMAWLVTQAAHVAPTAQQLANMPFYSLFLLHAILAAFLFVWWLLSGRPPLREFLNIRHENPVEVAAIGISVGVGGWMLTLLTAMLVALLLRAVGVLPESPEPPAMIGWMARLPLWKKAIIVLSAMTVEEFFFRSFLQKRIGLIASTILFALAHFTYAQPLLLIGVSIISIIIGIAFYRTKNVLPGVIAHGVFDAIQLFVIVPIAVKVTGIA